MKKEIVLLSGVLVLVVAGAVFGIVKFSKGGPVVSGSTNLNEQEKNIGPEVKESFESFSSGSTGAGDVSVELTPEEIERGKLKVDIAVNTHSVDLSQFDLKEITTLEYNGKLIKPETAPSLKGHHSFGTLVFGVGEKISSFTIKIRGIPKVEERIFEWRRVNGWKTE
jgi:hypothetical protein